MSKEPPAATRMNYWVTTQWPPLRDHAAALFEYVHVRADRADAGRLMKAGDLVAVYQFLAGPTLVEKGARKTRKQGSQAVVAIATVEKLLPKRPYKQYYVGRGPLEWLRLAKLTIPQDAGRVSVADLNHILNYRPDYNFRGYGEMRSGLKRVSKRTFDLIVEAFMRST